MSNVKQLINSFEERTQGALDGLDEDERAFVIDKLREGMVWSMICELESMCTSQLESPGCDLAKVGRMAAAARALTALGDGKS